MKRIALLALCALSIGGNAPGESSPLEQQRSALEKWIELKLLLSREREDWRAGKRTLEDRVDLLRTEVDAWREKTMQATNELVGTEAKLAELNARKAELKAGTADLVPFISGLEARLRTQLQRCPAPFQDRVRPLSQRMPAQPETTTLSLSERFQNAIGILNEMAKFGRELTEVSEVRDLPDGSRAEVTVLYVGLGQAYYCNEKGGLAGIGRPSDNGWIWEARNDLVGDVSAALAIYRNEKAAAYVALPAEVQHRGAAEAQP
jgi:hypothetical protein